MRARDFIGEYNVDNREGLGATPINANVDYRGLRVLMRPSTFLSLATKLDNPVSVDHIVQHMKDGGSLGSPFLIVDIPEDYFKGNFEGYARVIGHEGRNRMLAIQKVEGDDPVEVHIFPYGEIRSRHLTDDVIQEISVALVNQEGDRIVVGPGTEMLFKAIKHMND